MGFEQAFANFCTTRYAVGVANGADALSIALTAVGASHGTQVISASLAPSHCGEAIVHVGATPVFVDVDMSTGTICPEAIAAAITDKTAAIIVAHLDGRAADMEAIMDIACELGIAVIEDATEACGTEYKGQRVGSWGDIACFDFAPGKILGAIGDAGALTTNSGELAGRIRMLADPTSNHSPEHDVVGWNSRMDEIQAAVLGDRLTSIHSLISAQRERSELLASWLTDIEGVEVIAWSKQDTPSAITVLADDRNALIGAAFLQGPFAQASLPSPIHRMKAFTDRFPCSALPNTEKWARNSLTFRVVPGIAELALKY